MIKRIVALFLAMFFLAGSIVFPLGDFSLMRDLPQMYHSYTKIALPEEVGIIDFVGDYLLHGRDILGHNSHDKSENAAKGLQFQHTNNHLNVVVAVVDSYVHKQAKPSSAPISRRKFFITSDYSLSVFRPPIFIG